MATRDFKFSNGDSVIETVTGFSGIITGSVYYLTGCNQYLVVGKSKDGAEAPSVWYDEGRLVLAEAAVVECSDVTADDNGCDMAPSIGRRGA
jgi:hypothetical protein